MKNNNKIIPIVLCGGSGTRLWPISREGMPKQFLRLTGDQSLLQMTALRAGQIAGSKPEDLVVVSLGTMKGELMNQLGALGAGYTNHILSEPMARNTAGAVAFAALYVAEKFGADSMMWILPADHHIGDEKTLERAVHDSLSVVNEGYLLTFGINPARPETGYGYIKVGDVLKGGPARKAEKFVEKPDVKTAQSYIDDGNYMWNSGMFLFRTDAIIESFKSHAADIFEITARAMKSGTKTEPDAAVYGTLPEQPFDKAIMEKSNKVAVTPCDPEWSDIGGWESLWEITPKDSNGNAVRGDVITQATKNCMIRGTGGRLIAVAGLDNIVIVDTGEAILVADKRDGDAMKALVKDVKKFELSKK